MKFALHEFDMTLAAWLHRLLPGYDKFFLGMTFFGDPLFVLALATGVAIVAFIYGMQKLALSMLAVPIALAIGTIIKHIIARARPVSEYIHTLRMDTFSFPSGHSTGSTILYGMLAYVAFTLLPAPYKYIGAVGFAILPFLIGVSRVYLNVHFPSDVIGGWLLGLAVLAFVIFIVKPLAA